MFRCPWQEHKSGGLRRCSFQPYFCFLIFAFLHQHFHFPHQITLATSLSQVCSAFSQLEEGLENSLKDYYKKQIAQLNNLISLLLGNLSKGDRQKVGIIDRPRERKCTLIIREQKNSFITSQVMTICTIDVHSRDVVSSSTFSTSCSRSGSSPTALHQVSKMIGQRIESAQSFSWQSQLRHR